jgi:hypothetical protein
MDIRILIETGKNICETNPFYNTLNLLLKYFFLNNDSINISELIHEVTKSELEFQVFMIYKNYAIDLYFQKKNILNHISYDEVIYCLISMIKNNYEQNRNILEPYISSIEMNKNDIIEKYHYIKSSYVIKNDNITKLSELNDVISLLEESKKLEIKAQKCKQLALDKLYKLHLTIKNKITTSDELKLLK